MRLERKSTTTVHSPNLNSENSTPPPIEMIKPILHINNFNIATQPPTGRKLFTPPMQSRRNNTGNLTSNSANLTSKQIKFKNSSINVYLTEAEIPKLSKNQIRET